MTVVKFWFIRHGFSCGNLLAYAARHGKAQQKFISDPSLTRYGVETSESVEPVPRFIKIDFLFSSCLARAIQTAYYTFIKTGRFKGPIWVAPFLREMGVAPDNTPHPEQDTHRLGAIRRYVRKISSAYDATDRLGGIPEFIRWFCEHLDLFLPRELTKQEINVVVVTHGGRMQHDLHLEHPPRNNQCVVITVKDKEVQTSPKIVFTGVALPDIDSVDMDSCGF